jgi:hypothetical protein
MTEKRINPYTRLKEIGTEWANKIRFRDQRGMWFYPKKRLHEGWSLDDLYERVSAAEQLGYVVELKATEDGLEVVYLKELPPTPFEFR